MKLTPNFSLSEFTRSATAKRLGIVNAPTEEHLANLRLTALGMEMVRLRLGLPIKVTSGYRCPALNKAVGGTPTSAHAVGLACDFTAKGESAAQTAKRLKGMLPYDQLILETSRGVVHISFDPRLRMQALTQPGGPGTPIEQGINP